MKKFNLQLAKKGSQLITKDGKEAKLIYAERDSPHFPLVFIIENKKVDCYTKDGKFYIDKDSDNDIFLK